MAPKIMPIELSMIQKVFPSDAMKWMAEMKDIPERFKEGSYHADAPWEAGLWADIFYRGYEDIELLAVEGVDPKKAWDQLLAICGSFAPEHQHKMAVLAYLTSLWFTGARWKVYLRGTPGVDLEGESSVRIGGNWPSDQLSGQEGVEVDD
jgi:hypothetical protein